MHSSTLSEIWVVKKSQVNQTQTQLTIVTNNCSLCIVSLTLFHSLVIGIPIIIIISGSFSGPLVIVGFSTPWISGYNFSTLSISAPAIIWNSKLYVNNLSNCSSRYFSVRLKFGIGRKYRPNYRWKVSAETIGIGVEIFFSETDFFFFFQNFSKN